MITLDNVSVIFEERVALSKLNLTLNEKRIGVIGANGSGKSTFLRLLNGLQLPSSGKVDIDGLDTKKQGKDVRRKVGFVFQNPDNQIVMPVVEEDLAFGLKNLKLAPQDIAARIDTVLKRFSIEDCRTRPIHLLSGGQKQLLAICGVLLMQPDIIIFDEPTTQLDLRNKRIIMAMIEKLSEQVIMASHDLDYLQNFDRILVFYKSEIVCDDTPHKAISFYERLMAE